MSEPNDTPDARSSPSPKKKWKELSGPPPGADTAEMDAEKVSDRLKMLHDYTRFHIGVYIPAAALLSALAASKPGANSLLTFDPFWMSVAAILMGIAGFAGGIIATSTFEHSTVETFSKSFIGPYEWRYFKLLKGRWYIWLEHTAFWVSVGAVAIALCLGHCRA